MMKILWYNAAVLLVFAAYVGGGGDLGNNAPSATIAGVEESDDHTKSTVEIPSAKVTNFLDDHGDDVLERMKDHFDLSIKYLYTGIEFGSQKIQRPGMSKFLKEQSDSHWEDGISMLKKYMQRGGKTTTLHKKFTFLTGKREIDDGISNGLKMVNILKGLLVDSKQCAKDLNSLHRMSARRKAEKISAHHDGEWSHYLEEKLEEEAERTRKLVGHVTDLGKMSNSGLALNFFDSNL